MTIQQMLLGSTFLDPNVALPASISTNTPGVSMSLTVAPDFVYWASSFQWNLNAQPAGNYRFRLRQTSGTSPTGNALNTFYSVESSNAVWTWGSSGSNFQGYLDLADAYNNVLYSSPVSMIN